MMNKKPLLLVLLVGLLTVLTFCDPNYFGRQLTRNSSNPPDKVVETVIDTPDGADPTQDYFNVVSTFDQTNNATLVFPEILFVVDTSGSMGDEKNALKNALGGWLNQLQQLGVENFCVDVMESSPSGSNSGRLRAASGNSKCLCTDTLSVAQIVAGFSANIDSISFAGGSGEAGILSLHNALNDPAKFSANQNDGCFKNDKALAVIQMSDENDMCATVRDPTDVGCTGNATTSDGSTVNWNTVDWNNDIFPLLTGFVTTPKTAEKYVHNSCDEEAVRLRYCAEATPGVDGQYDNVITAETVADSLAEYNAALPSFGTAIIYNTTTFPSVSTVESKGWGFFEFADEFNQGTTNLATTANQADFNNQLNVIADSLAQTLTYTYRFSLPSPVCAGQEDSVKVKVNGALQPKTKYNLANARTYVQFKSNFNWAAFGGAAAEVTISYTKCE